jgi:hypothetical protein
VLRLPFNVKAWVVWEEQAIIQKKVWEEQAKSSIGQIG